MASLFTKIMNREIPAEILFEDDLCIAIRDISPQAPTHFLLIPRREIRSLAEVADGDASVLGHLLVKAGVLAKKMGIAKDGFRVVINTNDHGGQSVHHLHVHVLGGRQMQWPPG
jgi:histidine triad (HIT) family protein